MYNPSLHTATNKPIGLTGKPVDARTYYYDTTTFTYRPYASTAEVLAYLIGAQRIGHFSVIVGAQEWWFRDGITDADLIQRGVAVWGDIIGDVTDQTDLIDYINDGEIVVRIEIPDGAAYPVTYPLAVPYNRDYVAMFFVKNSGLEYRQVNDIELRPAFTDSSLTDIVSIDIYGYGDLLIKLYLKRNGMATQATIKRIVDTYADMETQLTTIGTNSLIYEFVVLSDEKNNQGDLTNYTYTNGILNWIATTPVNI